MAVRLFLFMPSKHILAHKPPKPPLRVCSAKGQQKKGQARMRRYDDLMSEAQAYVKASSVSDAL